MEKSFQLDQKEMALLTLVEQDRTQALANVGALSLDMEVARKNLDIAAERQRAFIRQALSARGVERFESARLQSGAILVTVQEPMMSMPIALPLEGGPHVVERVNGPISEVKE